MDFNYIKKLQLVGIKGNNLLNLIRASVFPIKLFNRLFYCYRLSVISVTVTKGEHPRGNKLYGTSGTIGRGVSQIT